MPLQHPIYLDNHATTRVDPRVFEAMAPYFCEQYGNAASRSHLYGWQAEEAVEQGRERVAALIGATSKEIVWTSGATEASNLALKGAAELLQSKGNHLVTQKTEHKATLDVCRWLERHGFEVTYLDVDAEGRVAPDDVARALTDKTILVSIMLANNEIGTLQPVGAIGALCRKRGILFHCDAVQGAGRVPFDVNRDLVDLVSLSAHKIYGPKGIGALYVRRSPTRVRLAEQIHGGGHERGMRSGTLNVPGIVGFGKAAELMRLEGAEENVRIAALRDQLENGLLAVIDHLHVNGSRSHRLPGNSNLSFEYVEGEALMMALRDVSVSSGSACTSASLEPSYVLRAIGRSDALAHSSLRFGVGRFNTAEEIAHIVETLPAKLRELRELSPLYEMAQSGIDPETISWPKGEH